MGMISGSRSRFKNLVMMEQV